MLEEFLVSFGEALNRHIVENEYESHPTLQKLYFM